MRLGACTCEPPVICPRCLVRIGFAKALITSNPKAAAIWDGARVEARPGWAKQILALADEMMAELAK